MLYRHCKLAGAVIALSIGYLSQAHALDYLAHCDDVLYSAKTSMNEYQIELCVSGDHVNVNYGPIVGQSEVNILLHKDDVYYVQDYNQEGAATGKVGIKFDVGRYHYYIHGRLMTFRVGDEEQDTVTVPLRKPETDLNIARLTKHKLKPE